MPKSLCFIIKIIYFFDCRNIVEMFKLKTHCDISRPVKESFRHTGHGSPIGNSWGSPAVLDPLHLHSSSSSKDDVAFRCKYFLKFKFYIYII